VVKMARAMDCFNDWKLRKEMDKGFSGDDDDK
jgi:hypothetical protein